MNVGLLALSLLVASSGCAKKDKTMREAFADKFLIGAAISVDNANSNDPKVQNLIKNQFSALVAENCMKVEEVQPTLGVFDFEEGDKLCALAKKNGQEITGHCLVWHSQTPQWMYYDAQGQELTREALIERMRNHIYTVAGHFKGKVKGWDVVNEAIEGNGELRQSMYYKIIGPDFIRLAFQFAHEADPDAELYYNDYGMDGPRKRAGVVRLIRELKEHGCRIDGVGMQSHVAFDTNLDEYEKSIKAFAAEGVKVMITELDLSVLPWPKGNFGAEVSTNFEYQQKMDPYKNGLSKEMQEKQDKFFTSLFDIYLRNAKDITRVTFWGLTDVDSWKNDWPIKGRTDYPLPFNRDLSPKGFVKDIIKMASDEKYNL